MKNSAREQNVAILRVSYVRYELCKLFLSPSQPFLHHLLKLFLKAFLKQILLFRISNCLNLHHKAPQAHPPRPRSRAIKPQDHRRKRVEYAPGRAGFDAAYLLFVQDF